jgi:hypothetical protein
MGHDAICREGRVPLLADGERRGRETLRALDPSQLADARRCLDGISAQLDDALARLAAFVEF